jgi:hypothetical protein
LRRDLFKRERVISIAKTIGVQNKLRDGFPFLGGDCRFVCHVMFDIVQFQWHFQYCTNWSEKQQIFRGR